MRAQVLGVLLSIPIGLMDCNGLMAMDPIEDLGVRHAMALMDQPEIERRRLDAKLATLNKKQDPLLWLQYAVARMTAEERGSSTDPARQK